MSGWRIWVDTGGTFTDCLARDPSGGLRRAKVLSSSRLRLAVASDGGRRARLERPTDLPPGFLEGALLRRLAAADGGPRILRHEGSPGVLELERESGWSGEEVCEAAFEEEAPVLAARLVTATAAGHPLPEHELRLATTRGTNALLERRGGKVALFVTPGLADLTTIGTQQRPELFTLRPERAAPLEAAVVEVPGRLTAQGREIEPLDLDAVAERVDRLLAEGIEGAAVALLHAFRDSAHEIRLEEWLRERGLTYVSRSSALAPRIGLLARAETAVVDAYLWPVIAGYLGAVRRQALPARLFVMTSAGGLAEAESFRPKDSLLSGPAGGVVGAAAAGRAAGREAVIAFDMGGTSTDVSRWAGDLDYRFETRVGDVRLLAPALRIETVAAGGGSVCWFEGGQLGVGPRSAGAAPGPACYGAGGPLTLTDVNLLLGRLDPARFGIPLVPEAARERAAELACAVRGDEETLLAGLLRIADERMAEAVRRISVRRGYDPAEHALVAFGGAGPQHACSLAELLGVRTVLVPPDAGLLSALGLGHARLERFAERQVLRPLSEVEGHVGPWLETLREEALEALPGAEDGTCSWRGLAGLRLAGQESTLEVEARPGVPLEPAFRRAYRDLYGYAPESRPVELESLRVVVSSGADEEVARRRPPEPRAAEAVGTSRACLGGGWRDTATFDRAELRPGDAGSGPSLVFEAHCTTVVPPGWTWCVDGGGALVVER